VRLKFVGRPLLPSSGVLWNSTILTSYVTWYLVAIRIITVWECDRPNDSKLYIRFSMSDTENTARPHYRNQSITVPLVLRKNTKSTCRVRGQTGVFRTLNNNCNNSGGSDFVTVRLWRFTFTTLVESDRALPTCGDLCRNSSFLSLLSALPALFRRACVSAFSILVQFLLVDCDFSTHYVHQKDRKEEKIKPVDLTFSLAVFWSTVWAFFSKIKRDLIDIISIICVILYIRNSVN
jgi:hypothetical protein